MYISKQVLQHIRLLSIVFFCFLSSTLVAQNTVFQGKVLDKETKEPLTAAIVKFSNSGIGAVADIDGNFKISNNTDLTKVEIGLMGYETMTLTIPAQKTTIKQILLEPVGINLNEVVIKASSQKYSKKDNPAVELIKKVIANKEQTTPKGLKDYTYTEFERYIFALNEFNPDSKQYKKYTFLKNYVDTSMIDSTRILPISVRNKVTDVFVSKDPKKDLRVIKGQQIEGIDQGMDQESIEAFVNELIRTVDITDNYITFLFNNFVSPLSSTQSVSFYKWYIVDTINVDNQKVVQLDFGPFKSTDLGFTGSLFVNLDNDYSIEKIYLNTPKKINLNWVTDLRMEIEYERTPESKIGYPKSTRVGMNLNLMSAIKAYIEKTVIVKDFIADIPEPSLFTAKAPISYDLDYNKKDKDYWKLSTPPQLKKDMKMDKLVEELKNIFIIKAILNVGRIMSSGYIPTRKDMDKNKFEIGNVATFASYNSVEGFRLKGGMASTKQFNKHIYLFGYGAYGFKDSQFKYMGEATWRFNDAKTHKEEFPVNNITASYMRDMNALGQTFTQAERDNFLMSLSSSDDIKLTYANVSELKYSREYYNGFSFNLNFNHTKQKPAGHLAFERFDADDKLQHIRSITNAVAGVSIRYAYNEKFMQRRRLRIPIPSESFVTSLNYEKGLKNVMGGEFNYHKLAFETRKEFWVTPYGKFITSVKAEKLWGKAPYPMLISPSANNSFTVQDQTFYLINPLEFIHDRQVSWEVYYHTGGFILNKIPFIKKLKWRELVGFRGFYGDLSDKNNPYKNKEMMLFPDNSFQTKDRTPYMEYNIGIENILNLFRIDYVRRINYKSHPDINKSGIRVSFQMQF